MDDVLQEQQPTMVEDYSPGALAQFAREKFPNALDRDRSRAALVKLAERVSALRLYDDIDEIPLDLHTALDAFALPSSFVEKHDEWADAMRRHKGAPAGAMHSVRDAFEKWLDADADREKDIHGETVVAVTDEELDDDQFVNYVYAGCVHLSEGANHSHERALACFQMAEEAIERLTLRDRLRKDFLYHIEIYRGMLAMHDEDFEEAKERFDDARSYRARPATAAFFAAYLAALENRRRDGRLHLNKLIEFDVARFKHAVAQSDFKLFAFALEEAAFYNVFREPVFEKLLPDIKDVVYEAKDKDAPSFQGFRRRLARLLKLGFEDYFTPGALETLNFLKMVSDRYAAYDNEFLDVAAAYLYERLVEVVDYLRNRVKYHFDEKIDGKLGRFKTVIEEKQREIEKLRAESGETRSKYQTHFTEKLQATNSSDDRVIQEAERRLKETEESNYIDPVSAFKKSLVNSAILSGIMLGVGALYELFGSLASGLSVVLAELLYTGLAFGLVVFLLGMSFYAFSIMLKSADVRRNARRLRRSIDRQKRKREERENRLRGEFDKKMSDYDDERRRKIEEAQRDIDKNRREMKKLADKYGSTMRDEKKQLLAKIESVFEMD